MRALRIVLIVPIFVYASVLAWIGIAAFVFWAVGYLALAFWSMIH
jgi:hypothetical protein